MYGYIYITTCLVNNKIYIGQHKSKVFADNKYLGSGKLLRRAIKQYGRNKFKVNLLERCDSKEHLDEQEKYWIKQYKLPDLKIGYNLTKGGQKRFFTDCYHTQESKKKMSDKAKQREHPATTLGRICIYKDSERRVVEKSVLNDYLSQGWLIGRNVKIKSWNKGHTKETDERVAKYCKKLDERRAKGDKIGFCGRFKEDNPRYNSDEKLIENVVNKGLKDIWQEHGKSYCKKYFHIKQETLERCLKLANIVETKEHTLYIRNKNRMCRK